MFEGGPNPSKVQVTPTYKLSNPPTPLVLIHDGGGTTFGYFILGSLYREVWAIHNPHYFDGGAFEGGMDEMARLYIQYMVDTGLKGKILLGGWSLGGYLSLAVSRMLAEDPDSKIKVVGIVMMDTPYHIPHCQQEDLLDDPVIEGVPDLVQKCFERCDEMLDTWEVPKWDAPACAGKTAFFGVGGRRHSVPPGKVLYKPFQGRWHPVESAQYHADEQEEKPEKSFEMPPTVLIRCVQAMPLPEGRERPYLIDKYRSERLLGWEANRPEFIRAVIDVDANHYNMFEKSHQPEIKNLTAQLREALEILDSMGSTVKPKVRTGPALDFF